MAVDASPVRWGFRLPKGRSCPPLREGPLEPVFCPPSRLASCGRGAPPEHPARTDRDGARARARARRQLRARAGARAPRARRPGGRARVAGGRASATTRRPSPASTRAVDAGPRARRAGTRITVHGDYDVDGVCSTAILVRALRALGADVDWYLPSRTEDGYGLSRRDGRRGSPQRGTQLLRHRRLRDHGGRRGRAGARRRASTSSSPTTTAPRADGALPDAPIVHPARLRLPVPRPVRGRRRLQARRRAAGGAGAIRRRRRGPRPRRARHGRRLRPAARREPPPRARGPARAAPRRASPACARCMRVAKVDPGALDARAIGFRLAPRINAAGRLHRADAGLELLLTDDAERAAAIADELDHANAERRHIETRILFEAEAQVARARRAPGLRARRRGLAPGRDRDRRLADRRAPPPPGVLIALGRRPSGTGSGRSIPAFDLLGGARRRAPRTCCATAATAPPPGCTIAREQVDAFRAAFDAHAAAVLAPEDLVPAERVDAVVGGRRARPRAGRGARAPRAVRDRQPAVVAARARRAARRPAPDGGRAATCASPSSPAASAPARSPSATQPAARRRRASTRRSARAQRVERRRRAAARPAPRPAPRARGRSRSSASPRTAVARRARRAGGAAAAWRGATLARRRRPARPPRRRHRRHAGRARRPRASRCSSRAPTPGGAAGTSRAASAASRVAAWHALERDPALAARYAHVVALDPPRVRRRRPRCVDERLARWPGATGAELRFAAVHEPQYDLRAGRRRGLPRPARRRRGRRGAVAARAPRAAGRGRAAAGPRRARARPPRPGPRRRWRPRAHRTLERSAAFRAYTTRLAEGRALPGRAAPRRPRGVDAGRTAAARR